MDFLPKTKPIVIIGVGYIQIQISRRYNMPRSMFVSDPESVLYSSDKVNSKKQTATVAGLMSDRDAAKCDLVGPVAIRLKQRIRQRIRNAYSIHEVFELRINRTESKADKVCSLVCETSETYVA
ncbi:unnamed protein product [Gongylonema pulchrum]|uniref:UDPG_MGDP_dh_N domain-containing protein n=1 Tax=Gongylonema pulchrum TaxID=637853 RepID=A0A183ELK6_9BILA|nr:unnamed protein product [Gongylonema pulchrum]VDN39047.1 unnamed protein product [Gongylonema pulchrum]